MQDNMETKMKHRVPDPPQMPNDPPPPVPPRPKLLIA